MATLRQYLWKLLHASQTQSFKYFASVNNILIGNQQMHQNDHFIVMSSQMLLHVSAFSSSVWDRRLPTECTAAYWGLLY
jgi:hypothetical protein